MDETMRDDFAAEEKQESGIGQSTLRQNTHIGRRYSPACDEGAQQRRGRRSGEPGADGESQARQKNRQRSAHPHLRGEPPEIVVDAYITVKYGLRIPDVCWTYRRP